MFILAAGLLTWVRAASASSTDEFVWTVGTETNGRPIQQVQWLFHDQALTKTNAPIWAGTRLTIIEETQDRVKVKSNKSALPSDPRWALTILQGNTVIGWMPRQALIKVLQHLDGGDGSSVTNYCVSLQFKDGSRGGVAIPWILDRRNRDFCQKAVVGLRIGEPNDVWFISTITNAVIATNSQGRSCVLPGK